MHSATSLLFVPAAATGMVLFLAGVPSAHQSAVTTTNYGIDEDLKTSVPAEMRFTRINNSNEQVVGVATYGRFRQFQVGTNETIKK